MLLEGFDGLVDELAVRRRVPPEPIAGIALETPAIEARGFVGTRRFLWLSLAIGVGAVVEGKSGLERAGNHVSEDFSVLERENGY